MEIWKPYRAEVRHNTQTDIRIVAFTTYRDTGSLKQVDWKQQARKYEHLAGIIFSNLGKRPTVDKLIELDYSVLHYSCYSSRDKRGEPGQPIGRLTPLGWMSIGNQTREQDQKLFNRTYFVRSQENRNDLDNIFLRTRNIKTPSKSVFLNSDERKALSKVEQSFEFMDRHYEVGVQWKNVTPSSQNNYNMALTRFEKPKERLNKDPSIANDYIQTTSIEK
ncbi:unnamed protein product [Mytilus coruscus]|uniref:Uncharacterized protein n=1 Tax=Mytilus coruscus TaxID=42192 RepID=A0A6J8D1W5_MYTCO|nr:unnamed protein product [Mytilus coruscus]